MTEPLSLLGLLHPDGAPSRVVVLGTACPPDLARSGGAAPDKADLVVVAPSAAELGIRGWLDSTVQSLPDLVAPNGIICLHLPPGDRRRIRHRLRAASLVLESDVLHVPSWAATQYLVPLRGNTVVQALDRLGLLRSRRRRMLARLLALPGVARLAGRHLGAVSLVVRRQGARPLAAWLMNAAGVSPASGTVIVRAKWRLGKGGVVLQAFDGAARTVAVAKTTLTGSAPDGRTEREIINLERLGPAARAAGAAVPTARLAHVGGRAIMVASAVAGTPASELLASRRLTVGTLLDGLAEWLEAWSRLSVTTHLAEPEWLDRAVLAPARLVVPHLEHGARYLAELEERCATVAGTAVPLVATHGDLTMSNVLVTPPRGLGVVDWEAAQTDGLPLRDFWYGAVDAAAALDRYADRRAAFARCLSDREPLGRNVLARAARLARAIGLGDNFATLCFHACWLQHAVDEHRKRAPGEPQPFRAIVQYLAANPARFRVAGVSA